MTGTYWRGRLSRIQGGRAWNDEKSPRKVYDLTKDVVARLTVLRDNVFPEDWYLDDIIEYFRDLMEDADSLFPPVDVSTEDFDEVWHELYNWADKNRLWIRTQRITKNE